jgi:hypothetical protein
MMKSASVLPKMNPAEMRRLRDQLTARLSLISNRSSDRRDNVVMRSLAAVMKRKGLLLPSNVNSSVPTELAHWLASLGLNQTEEQMLVELGFSLVVDDLRKVNVPVTAKNLLRNAVRIPSVIDREFPGYAQVGAIRLIIGKREGLSNACHVAANARKSPRLAKSG